MTSSGNVSPNKEGENRPWRADNTDPDGGFLRRSLWPARRLRQLRFPWSNSGSR